MNRLLMALAAMGMVFAAQGEQKIPRPEVPKSLEAPAGEEVILVGHATAVQIYECKVGANLPGCSKRRKRTLPMRAGKPSSITPPDPRGSTSTEAQRRGS